MQHSQNNRLRGFTLIEMSIVLVIIGLIVGGVLVGQDLIRAAGVRATISQIEKYNTAVNTFKGKYGYLPGDLNVTAAGQFGFVTRAGTVGRGDGNGIVEGYDYTGSLVSGRLQGGETLFFWEDLSSASLIDGSFNTASDATGVTVFNVGPYLPAARLGGGNYVYVYSNNGTNYYGLSGVTELQNSTGTLYTALMLSVNQALSVDTKIDDGLPHSGNVTAMYITSTNFDWADGAATSSADAAATPGSSTTCYDNGNSAGATQHYSMEISNGSNVNCALSFRFQ